MRSAFGKFRKYTMQASTDRKVGLLFIAILGATTAFLPLSLHIFFPALPDVKSDFMTSEAVVNLTISVPLFVMAFASLFYGSLSDRYGRRPVLLSSIAIFAVSYTHLTLPTIYSV